MTKNLTYKALFIAGVTIACFLGIFGVPTSVEEIKTNFQKRIHLGLTSKAAANW